MAKFRKKLIFVVILALCLATCLTLVACNPDPPATADYSVTVKIGDTPQSGVSVKLAKDGAEITQNTGTDGKASFELEKGTYSVSLSNLPEHYVVPANATLTLTAENPNVTIALEKEFAYVVKLVNEDGTAFTQSDVSVMACNIDTKNCGNDYYIDANGIAYLYGYAKANYHVKVLGLNGYAYECDENGYYNGGENSNLTSTVTELTVKLYPVKALEKENGTALTPEEKSALGLDADAVAYKYSKELAAGEKVYYSLESEISGEFSVYVKKYTEPDTLGNNASILNYYSQGEQFVLGIHLINAQAGDSYLSCKDVLAANTPFYYYADNISNQTLTAEFIIVYPAASYVKVTDDVNKTVNVTAAGKDYAVIEFHPKQAGYYKFSTKGDTATYIKAVILPSKIAEAMSNIDSYAANSNDFIKATAGPDGGIAIAYEKNAFEKGYSDTIYIAVAVESSTAVSFDVEIKKVNDLANTVNTVQAPANLAQATRPESDVELELEKLPMSDDTEVVLGDDSYYHLDDKDGDIVYVMLVNPIDSWSVDAALVYFDMLSQAPAFISYVYDVTPAADVNNTAKGNTYDDYRLFLRGFINYEYEPNKFGGMDPVVPDTLVQPNCYAAKVNEDGCYPLTEELKDFLETFTDETGENYKPLTILLGDMGGNNDSNYWKLALYHYIPYVEPDVIVGEYLFESNLGILSDEKLGVGDDYYGILLKDYTFKLVLEKKGNYTIYMFNEEDFDYDYSNPYEEGTWTKVNGNYTFYANDYYSTVYQTVEFNSETGYLKLIHTPTNEYDINVIWEFNLAPAEDAE